MKMIKYLILCLVTIFAQSNMQVTAQCTEAKDTEMAKYMKLTKTQDEQGCSQCAMLAMYFCSAKYSIKQEDIQKVGALITACKTNIRNMGQPYCCPDYLNKEPQWGIMAGNAGSQKAAGSGTALLNENAKTGNTNPGNNSQKLQQTEEVLNDLLKQLEINSANPLNIDTKFLNDFSGLLPEGSLKNTLQSYGTNLGTDGDLSYRQVYWDVASGFKQNPSLASETEFSKTMTGLSLLLDNSEVITNSLINNAKNYKFGAFMNDQNFVTGLSNATGSYETGQAIANGVELAAIFTQAFTAGPKFREEYKKLANLSNELLYAEKDPALTGALIDAYLGMEPNQAITPMYRYDFINGATLRVENGILKYFNVQKSIVKNLMVVDKRHDGEYYKSKDMRFGYSSILISPDDKAFYIYVNPDAISKVKCGDCLKKCGYLIDTETGEIIYTKLGEKYACDYPLSINNTRFAKNNVPVIYYFQAGGKFYYTGKDAFGPDDKRGEAYEGSGMSGLDKEKKFLINNKAKKFKRESDFAESIFIGQGKNHYLYEKEGSFINLFWGNSLDEGLFAGDGTRYASSMLQIAREEKYYNADAMVNELTGIAMRRNGDLFFTSKMGKIGKMNGADYKLDDPAFTANLRAAMNKKIFAPYNFITGKTYASAHGLINQNDLYPLYPSLELTPDEKFLIYTVTDNLYLVNTNDLNQVKHFTLSFQPYGYFFTKENGDWVINLQGLNDFKFPVTKKYSIPKLLKGVDQSAKLASKDNNKSSNTNLSIADEINKLKVLLDAGTITKEEFDAAKKQLLNK